MLAYYLLVAASPFVAVPIVSRFVAPEVAFKALGAVCFVYALSRLAMHRVRPHYLYTWPARFFVALVAIVLVSHLTLSIFSGVYFEAGTAMTYVSMSLLYFVTLTVVDSVGKMNRVLLAVAAGLAWGSIHVMQEWLQYRATDTFFRPGLAVGDSNMFATSAGIYLPVMFLLTRSAESIWQKMFFGAALAMTVVAITLGASRGGFVTVGVAFIALATRSRRKLRTAIIGCALVLIPALMLPSSPIRRFTEPKHSDRYSETARLTAWRAGLAMFAQHPVTGIGIGRFKGAMAQYRFGDNSADIETIGHNVYVETAAELGILGLAFLIGLIVSLLTSLGRVRRDAELTGNAWFSNVTAGLQAGITGFAVGAFFLSTQYYKLFWLAAFLCMCIAGAYRRRAGGRNLGLSARAGRRHEHGFLDADADQTA